MLTYLQKPYHSLKLNELYRIAQLRQEVFVVEQNCPYLDFDGLDEKANHVLGLNEEGVIHAYARVFPKGISYESFQSIGRIITSSTFRGKGEGIKLIRFSIETCQSLFGKGPIKISAQSHLRNFYRQFGFIAKGDGYLEDGIPHHAMILDPFMPG